MANARGVYDSAGNPVTVFTDGESQRVELTVDAGWVKLPLSPSCDLYELDTVLAAGGKRVIIASTADVDGIVAGQAPTTEQIAKSAFRWPGGIYTKGCERALGVDIYVALDPTDATDQADPAILVVTQAAEVC